MGETFVVGRRSRPCGESWPLVRRHRRDAPENRLNPLHARQSGPDRNRWKKVCLNPACFVVSISSGCCFNPLTIQQDAAYRRSEEHTSELQSLMRISYAVFCLKKTTSTYKSKPIHKS